MQYRRDKKGNELSVLGYGCMRFTKNGSSVDLDKAEKEVMAAIKAGVNYFDTARSESTRLNSSHIEESRMPSSA